MMTRQPQTQAALAGFHPERYDGTVNAPIHNASTIVFASFEALLEAQGADDHDAWPLVYGTYGTAISHEFNQAIARLDGGNFAVSCSSGLAAVAIALFAVIKSGCNILVADSVYQPTRRLCEQLASQFEVETRWYDPLKPNYDALLDSRSVAIYAESPGTQTFEVMDIPFAAQTAHAAGIPLILDNSWASPLLFPAMKHGVDISLYSFSKYLSGNADCLLGTVVANEHWSKEVARAARVIGQCSNGDDMNRALRGLHSLAPRIREHARNAQALMDWLASCPQVQRIISPVLPSSPGHAYWKRDFHGSNGLFSFLLQPVKPESLAEMMNALQLFVMGFSWGSHKSLIVPCSGIRHRKYCSVDTQSTLLRVSAGLEHPDDLIEDLSQALQRLEPL